MIHLLLLLLAQETLSTFGRSKPSPEILPFNQVVTTTLKDKESKLFYLLDLEQQVHPLSVTVIPCSAPIHWAMLYRNDPGIVNDTEILREVEQGGPQIFRATEMNTFKKSAAEPGLYMVPIWAPDGATTLQIFVSLDPGGPHDVTHLQDPGLKLSALRRRKLAVRWQPSVVNPQHMHYCLIASKSRYFSKFCEAEEILKNKTSDTTLTCVQKKNSAMLNNLEKGKTYKVSLFAINVMSNLTVPYGNGSVLISPRVKPIALMDGKPKSVNLRKHEGRVNFRFRVSPSVKETFLHMYVIACGGSVTVQVMNRRTVLQSRRVTGYGRFEVRMPHRGDYYSLKVTAADADQLARIRSVEAFATQFRSKFPVPEMPSVTDVHEYVSRRRCSSVTVGWVPAPATYALYCVLVRRLPAFSHISPPPVIGDHCGLEARQRRSNFVAKDCSAITAGKEESVTTHNVTNLTPGTAYSVQITVKKPNGRTLSYRILNVFTKHTCD